MLQTRIPNPREIESREPESTSLQHTLSYAFAVFGRQYPQMIFTMLLCVSLAGVYLLTAPKRYTGTAVLLIDSRKMQGLQTQASLGGENPIDSAMVDSQVEILRSETIASAVIKDLRLVDTPEFTGPEGGLLGSITGLFSSLSPESRPSDLELLRMAIIASRAS
jgi:succinoglycan biosynthesis transport protein ExoP